MVAAWNATVIRRVDRLFSDSGFVDYEDALSTVVPPDLIEERWKRLNQVERVGETGSQVCAHAWWFRVAACRGWGGNGDGSLRAIRVGAGLAM
jgi:hypothetical protein